MILYKYVYAGCRARQYITLTFAHTHLNLWVLPGLMPKPMKVGFYLPIVGIFCGYPSNMGPIVIPIKNHSKFRRQSMLSPLVRSLGFTFFLYFTS